MIPIAAAIAVSIAAGLWSERRFGAGATTFSRRSLLFVLYAVMPPVTFLNLVGADLDVDAGIGIVLGLASLTVLGFTAWLIATRLLCLSRPSTGALISSVIVANTGYLGYAVIAALLGFDRLSEAVAYDVLVSSPVLLLGSFSVGAAFGFSAGETRGARVRAFLLRNPALYAAILALLAPASLAPQALVDVSRVVIIAILPLGFFAVGVALAADAERGAIAFPPRFDAPVATAVALRLIGGPLLLFALAAAFIDLPPAYLLLAAMPCGLNTMIVGHAYGLDLRIAAGAITWSTAIFVAGVTIYSVVT